MITNNYVVQLMFPTLQRACRGLGNRAPHTTVGRQTNIIHLRIISNVNICY